MRLGRKYPFVLQIQVAQVDNLLYRRLLIGGSPIEIQARNFGRIFDTQVAANFRFHRKWQKPRGVLKKLPQLD
jgi:hypothetical protein